MKLRCLVLLVWMALSVDAVWAQLSSAPVLVTPANVQYPPIARAAHVSGDVVVDFSIAQDGSTDSVQVVSGPAMLTGAVEGQVKQWRFRTPLPVGAQKNFEASYKFDLEAMDNVADDLDEPPFVPCCGDMIMISSSAAQVKGEVRSTDGTQTIDVTPAVVAALAADRCPEDKEKQAPAETSGNDFVELYRLGCSGGICSDYRVKVYRGGRVEWHGRDHVAMKGESSAQINPDAADTLLARFQKDSFWAGCSVPAPAPDQDTEAEDFYRADFITANIGGHAKTVNTNFTSFADANTGARFAWAVDKAADTHRWRHGDAATESWGNMREDILLPKQGMTLLIRSTWRFNPGTGQQTFELLKQYLAAGVDVDAEDESGWTALVYAVEMNGGGGEAVKALLEGHANVNHASPHGDTALMIGAWSNRSLSEQLLKAGAEINARNGDGVTALMLLAQYADPDELKEAIAAGADAAMKDNAGHTALDYLEAASCGKALIPLPEITGMVIVASARISCPSTNDRYLRSKRVLQEAMKKALPR